MRLCKHNVRCYRCIMGSGSSKAKSVTVVNTPSPRKSVFVANVNKQEFAESSSSISTLNQENNNIVVPDRGVQNTNSEEDEIFQVNESNKDKKKKIVSTGNVKRGHNNDNENPSALVFKEDSDLDDDIDEVLKIPVAVNNSEQNESKEKKMKKELNKNSKNLAEVHYSINKDVTKVSTDTQSPLPETYVQRLQRQQYKFQHNLLLHDNTVIKKPQESQQDNEDENSDSQHVHFDATKFRAVNRSRDTKQDPFSTESEAQETSIYQQPPQANFDDFELPSRDKDLVMSHLPQYNQSELDLMKELENEMM